MLIYFFEIFNIFQFNHHSGSDSGFSISQQNSGSSFTSGQHLEIPSGSYLPVAPPLQHNLPPLLPPSDNYGPPPSAPQYRPQTSYGPPPSGNYGQPSGAFSGLAIQHGTVSGNLKPWPVQGEPPRKPIPFKQPLPQGLIESIGETVKHIDQQSSLVSGGYSSSSGYEIQASHDVSGGLYSLPLENAPRPFYNGPQAVSQELELPIEQTHFLSTQNTDCNHGIPQDSYGPPPSGSHQQLRSSSEVSQSVVSSYIPPPSGIVHSESSASGYTSASEQVSHEVLPEPSQLRAAKSEESSSSHHSSDDGHIEIQQSNERDLSQITNGDFLSVQGKLGSYQLQFQSANGLGDNGDSNSVDGATHQQLLTEGLLQQILSAIEQPNQQSDAVVPQASYDQHRDHRDAADFLHSPDGQAIISETKKTK